MKKIWMKKFSNLAAANKADQQYYLKMGCTRRLETVQLLRDLDIKINKDKNEGRKGLRRVITVKLMK